MFWPMVRVFIRGVLFCLPLAALCIGVVLWLNLILSTVMWLAVGYLLMMIAVILSLLVEIFWD